MITVTAYGEQYQGDRVSMGAGSLTLYRGDEVVAAFGGVTDFSGFVIKEGTKKVSLLDMMRDSKLEEVNAAAQQTIYAGIDVETSKGEEHFSLTGEDQTNIQNLMLQIQAGQSNALYHADGNLCRAFSPTEVMTLATAATAHKTFHLTYCNHLRQYIKGIEDYGEMKAIQYGMELPPELAASMAALLGV